jgi:membrane-bound ClpP family serine protease
MILLTVISLIALVLIIYLVINNLSRIKLLNKLILSESTSKNDGFTSNPQLNELLGKEGITLTVLRPAGTAEIEGNKIDVIAESEFLEKGIKIKVIKVDGIKVVVRQIK